MTYLAVFCHLHLSRYSKICPAISCLLDYPCLLYSNLQWKNNAFYRSLLCCFCIYNGKLPIANAYVLFFSYEMTCLILLVFTFSSANCVTRTAPVREASPSQIATCARYPAYVCDCCFLLDC